MKNRQEMCDKVTPKSQSSVSKLLWNPCREEPRKPGEQSEAPPSVSVLFLIKYLGSVCNNNTQCVRGAARDGEEGRKETNADE